MDASQLDWFVKEKGKLVLVEWREALVSEHTEVHAILTSRRDFLIVCGYPAAFGVGVAVEFTGVLKIVTDHGLGIQIC